MHSLTVERQPYHIEQKGDSNFVISCGAIGGVAGVVATTYGLHKVACLIAPIVTSLNVYLEPRANANGFPQEPAAGIDFTIGLVAFSLPVFLHGYGAGRYIGSKLEEGAEYCYSLLGDYSTHNE